MKKIIAFILVLSLLLTACNTRTPNSTSDNQDVVTNIPTVNISNLEHITPNFTGLDDEDLHYYLEDRIYEELITNLHSEDYVVEDVSVKYASKEYLEEVKFNSQSTSYFGYTTEKLDSMFEGEKYVFTLSDDNKTTVQELSEIEKSSKEIMMENIVVGSGIILATATLSLVAPAAGLPVAIQVILCASAKGATTMAISSAGIAGTISIITEMITTGDYNESFKSGCLSASEGFKWGALSGAIASGSTTAVTLKLGTEGGLTMSQVATIQKESKYPIEIIKKFNSVEQYNICKDAGLKAFSVNGKTALIRNIDLDYVDNVTGKTNLQLMQSRKAPIDPVTGQKMELHHLGQEIDSPLAILKRSEHTQNGNDSIWHILTEGFENPSSQQGWTKQRGDFWETMAEIMTGGV